MESKINEIISAINTTGLIERFGGWCFNKTDKELPYGVAIQNTDKGTLYGYDDNFYSSGFLFVKELQGTGRMNEVRVTVGIYVFTPRTKWDEEMNTYELPLNLFSQLRKKYKDIRFNSVIVDKYVANEVALIEIDFMAYGQCELPTPVWWDFSGSMTVGEFQGEGDTMEYGFRKGWGDDYGTLADFYTFYDKEGCYWIDGVLYVWGVNASIIQIGGVVFNDGTYNEAGYTSFEVESNPFPATGETATIKVKGTATETWDYEGTLTVAEWLVYGELVKRGYNTVYENPAAYGSMNPVYKYYYNGYGFIEYNIGSSQLIISGECQKIKIGNTVYVTDWVLAGLTSCDDITDPFPKIDETITIKIKL